jgi:hypothetical protein
MRSHRKKKKKVSHSDIIDKEITCMAYSEKYTRNRAPVTRHKDAANRSRSPRERESWEMEVGVICKAHERQIKTREQRYRGKTDKFKFR